MIRKGFLFFIFFIFLVHFSYSCKQQNTGQAAGTISAIITGAERTEVYFPLIKMKKIAVVANQTSVIGKVHMVDSLFNAGFEIQKVFGPEHGFRGQAADGMEINNDIDPKLNIPVISLYGAHKKPAKEDLADVDVVLFDIQDVGVRFYTYISTMTYVMEACAENDIPLIILDRPNPHGDYVDGPVLEPAYVSFVGLHPVPVVYGMTIGEYALMVNGEGWLKDSVRCDLQVIPLENYNHHTGYELPVPPSPNLPNNVAVQLYPSLCFFEGTIISLGRGTDFPFQVIGHPDYVAGSYDFIPRDIPGKAIDPPHEGEICYGHSFIGYVDTVSGADRKLNLFYLLTMYKFFSQRNDFFNSYFDKLAGSDNFRKQIIAGMTEDEIRQSWDKDILKFKILRKKYLLYPDFE
jgi:uncharacterized protein YbbC (DUF1343 family)